MIHLFKRFYKKGIVFCLALFSTSLKLWRRYTFGFFIHYFAPVFISPNLLSSYYISFMPVLFKRIFLTAALLIIIFFIAAYFIIPHTLVLQQELKLNCNATAASRAINTKWTNIFIYHSNTNDFTYKMEKPLYDGSSISISKNDKSYATKLLLMPVTPDSSLMRWSAEIPTGNNPLTKVLTYFNMQALKHNMSQSIHQIQSFLSKTKNVYGYDISYITLTDTVLVSTKMSSAAYPSVDEIYTLINDLKKFIAMQHATETNFPMLNITRTNNQFITMAGIPVNKTIAANSRIEIKRLIPIKNKILTTEVQGGPAAIKDAYNNIELFMQDHSLSAPVIPYELIITDRKEQKDSTKWVTRIMYPVA